MMPALDTTPSSCPKRSIVSVTARLAVASSPMSPSISRDAARLLAEGAFEIGPGDVDRADQPAVVEQLPRGRAADAVRRAGDERRPSSSRLAARRAVRRAFFQASMPPCRWQAEASRASCAACTAMAERSPNAQ